ncbi:dihydrolipoamide acetyltransferase family protein [Sphingobium subterraneum]|uniref:Dihydrolipoamide acetyltransferase component of pyruvate dehydrogenase complex n=1 Tax=Sphingobium subterraneum TaxID=627688 RepID=A0A841J0A0_9SPHN|nr:dihydrolipoamide acetyltransferase family protein [Sphingobium subterraneum]MBB6124649.1 2-oxoisovalerate dehydrogenase E2 component (dihydrolipoyl transacylase) [Sphingobium subterraneum]
MSRYIFRLPDVGEGVAEAEIVVWHVKVGDRIEEDESLVDVMTDKATVDMTSPVSGTVIATYGAPGEMLAVGSPLAELEVEGALDEAQAEEAAAAPPATAAMPVVETMAAPEPAALAPTPVPAEPVAPAKASLPLAAPATRRRAQELGIDLHAVNGTGPGGRIRQADLDAYLERRDAGGGSGLGLVKRTAVTEQKIIGMRRKIAEKMQEAKRHIPHITYVEEADLTELEALRVELNTSRADGQPKLTLLPFFVRALARLLPQFPHINARYDDEAGVLHQFAGVHVGIATQTPNGLTVPVVRHAEARSIWDCAAEIARVSAAARDGTATRDELSGSTISITSLGPLGGIATTPIINYPEVAIIGPNKLVDRPIVHGSFLTVRKTMNISSSFDHRIVDGYDAALFIQGLKRMLEHPALIFMD